MLPQRAFRQLWCCCLLSFKDYNAFFKDVSPFCHVLKVIRFKMYFGGFDI